MLVIPCPFGESEVLRLLVLSTKPSPQEEAVYILDLFNHSKAECIKFVHDQFNVIQSRNQALLTLGTLTLTITGFSGPRIAATNLFSRYSIALGIFLVLLSLLILLIGIQRVRWVTQFKEVDPEKTLVSILTYRNQKIKYYGIELFLLVIGLSCYVASVISFLIFYEF